jgi:hypothetical protein
MRLQKNGRHAALLVLKAEEGAMGQEIGVVFNILA